MPSVIHTARPARPRWRRPIVVAAGIAAASVGCLVPSALVGATDDAIPDTTVPAVPNAPAATSTATLPLLGASLTVDITTDAGGGLLGVALTPNDTYTATHVRSRQVAFENADGSVRVSVSAKHGGERVAVRSGALADISGAGGWSGDVFGTGVTSNVSFTIGAGADGGPDITGVAVDSTIGATVGATERGTSDHHGGTWQWARAVVTFEDASQTRTLSIKATTGSHDGEPVATLKLSLGRTHGGRIADGEAVGPHTWSGQLCDGTAASIAYTLNADGSVSDVIATPEAEVSTHGSKTVVSFARRESVSIRVKTDDAGALTVTTRERQNCGRNDPEVNTEIAPDATVPDDGDHNGWGDGNHHGGNGGNWGGGDHRGDGDGNRDGGGDGDGGHDGGGHRDGGDDNSGG